MGRIDRHHHHVVTPAKRWMLNRIVASTIFSYIGAYQMWDIPETWELTSMEYSQIDQRAFSRPALRGPSGLAMLGSITAWSLTALYSHFVNGDLFLLIIPIICSGATAVMYLMTPKGNVPGMIGATSITFVNLPLLYGYPI
ncbi:hypothetical protein [Pseudomonas sp. RIT-To-2]|uniref:hypothetical protein n=1 Tax=Pseudomonas sp. RIT-To-2 TaxID=3462541 RepID=UPI0024137AE4